MPTYTYKCRRCGREFEKFQKITDPPGARCPACKGAADRVITGGAGLLFKGGGFYITDYRSEGYKQAAKRESGDGPATGPGETRAEKPSAEKGGSSKGGAAKGSGGSSEKPGKRSKAEE
jgi:putative FmdB family regulatory protein